VGDLNGKVAVVTGASTGVGREIARQLAQRGAAVWMVSRDPARAREALEDVRKTTGGTVESVTGDWTSITDIRRVAGELVARLPRLDILVNNAGFIPLERKLTVDGIEEALAVNHVAHFVFTQQLLGLLEKSAPSRVVLLVGRSAPIDFDDLNFEKSYVPFDAYARSKFAGTLIIRGLAKRVAGKGITVLGAFPGLVETPSMKRVGKRSLFNRLLWKLMMKQPPEGAKGPVWVATEPSLTASSGQLFGNGKPLPSFMAPKGIEDDATVERMWSETEKLIAGK
jgi:retinol dehydrogenase 12